MRAHRSNRCLLSRARMNCPCFIQNGDDQFRRRTWKVFTSRFISRYLYFQRFGHGERSRIRITSAWGNRKDIQCTLSWVRQRGVGAQSLRHRIWDRYHIGVLNPACWAERARRENSWVVMSIYWERRRTYRILSYYLAIKIVEANNASQICVVSIYNSFLTQTKKKTRICLLSYK